MQHSLKLRHHQHDLRGLLTCARCGARLQYTVVRGKAGGEFAYYVCSRRHRSEGCDLPYIPAHELEQRLEHNWPMYVQLDPASAEAIGERLHDELTGDEASKQAITARLAKRLARLDAQQARALMRRGAEVYALAQPEVRCQLNRAFIARLGGKCGWVP
jgi:hypothetical protein